jgi:hypothetical protein
LVNKLDDPLISFLVKVKEQITQELEIQDKGKGEYNAGNNDETESSSDDSSLNSSSDSLKNSSFSQSLSK